MIVKTIKAYMKQHLFETAFYGIFLTAATGHSEVPNSGLFSEGEKFPLHRYATSLDQHFVVALETSQREAVAGPEVERFIRRPFLLRQTHPALTRLHDLHRETTGGLGNGVWGGGGAKLQQRRGWMGRVEKGEG